MGGKVRGREIGREGEREGGSEREPPPAGCELHIYPCIEIKPCEFRKSLI